MGIFGFNSAQGASADTSVPDVQAQPADAAQEGLSVPDENADVSVSESIAPVNQGEQPQPEQIPEVAPEAPSIPKSGVYNAYSAEGQLKRVFSASEYGSSELALQAAQDWSSTRGYEVRAG